MRDKAYDLLLSTLLSHSVPEVSVDQIASANFRILDARAYRAFKVSHIEGATWVGYDNFNISRLAEINTQATVTGYCSTGYRNARIAKLHQQGCTHVVNVYGGIFDWSIQDTLW